MSVLSVDVTSDYILYFCSNNLYFSLVLGDDIYRNCIERIIFFYLRYIQNIASSCLNEFLRTAMANPLIYTSCQIARFHSYECSCLSHLKDSFKETSRILLVHKIAVSQWSVYFLLHYQIPDICCPSRGRIATFK